MKFSRALLLFGLAAALAMPAAAQTPTGTIVGTVTDGGLALPGVTVTVGSPALAGQRVAITEGNGQYIFKLLPPGMYTVTFQMMGYQNLETTVSLPAAQSRTIDAVMTTEIGEEIEVTANYSAISSDSQSATTFDADTLEKLPLTRDIGAAVALSPGVHATGPGGNFTISGSMSFENLFMVNGVVVNENLRGQPFDLFIEDAIQETTVQTGGVSAEYGRFSGGVVNTITKSGGNEFTGSFRVSLTRDDWTRPTPKTGEQDDTLNKVYEATFGGFILKDKVWFFLAGRDRSESSIEQTSEFNLPYPVKNDQTRLEAKLTFSPHPRHRIVAGYLGWDQEQAGYNHAGNALDPSYVDDYRELPLDSYSANYTGVLTENLFIEAQWSRREFTFVDSGSSDTTIEGGTIYSDYVNGGRWNSPQFGSITDESRDSEDYLAKGSYFLTTDSMGSHEFTFGYDNFADEILSNNNQSGSDWLAYVPGRLFDANTQTLYPIIPANGNTWLVWYPVTDGSVGNDFTTESLFANDTWRLNEKLTFNLGVRYDKNDGVDGEGKSVVSDSQISPRLGLSYDLNGDGNWTFHATYGWYVAAIANSVGDSSSAAGTPSIIAYYYLGDDINTDPACLGGDFSACTSGRAALTQMFDWFYNVAGGPTVADPWFVDVPGSSTVIDENLASPHSEEFTVGLTKRLGNRGLVRMDYVHRDYKDFYSEKRDLTTGTVQAGSTTTDLAIVVNEDNILKRAYDGVHLQAQYRLTDTVTVGGNYTWSHAIGNFNGETSGSGPVTGSSLEFPEYKDPDWNLPVGDLSIDQRHKTRAWLVWDAFSSDRNSLSISGLATYFSGSPYGAVASLPSSWVLADNPGYLDPPDSVDYYFTSRSHWRTNDTVRLDLAINYSFFFGLAGKDIELYLQPEILNVFNETAVIGVDTTIYTADDDATLQPFNPFTDTPVEGVNWVKGPNFGQPLDDGDYQAPRTFRFSVGFRF